MQRWLTRWTICVAIWRAIRPSHSLAPTPEAELREDLLEATLEHADVQLLAQIADETSLDGRTMGILAFNGALLAADIAAKDILGPSWWTPLLVIGVATLPCLRSAITKDTDLGPLATTFYTSYGGLPSVPAREQLLVDLGAAFVINAKRVKAKRNRLRLSLATLVVGLTAAAVIIPLDRPTTMKRNGQGNAKASTSSSFSGATTGSVAPASRGTQRHPSLTP